MPAGRMMPPGWTARERGTDAGAATDPAAVARRPVAAVPRIPGCTVRTRKRGGSIARRCCCWAPDPGRCCSSSPIPAVAAGVADHSDFRADPWRRLAGTLRSFLTIVYGTTGAARAEIRRLNTLHREITGPGYAARDPELGLWVHATLIDSTIAVADAWLEPLPAARRAAFYAETRPVGRAFGVPDAMLPADLEAFERYVADMLGAAGPVRVSAVARELAGVVLRPPLGPLAPWLAAIPAERLRLDAVAVGGLAACFGARRLRPGLGSPRASRLGLARGRLARLAPDPAPIVPPDAPGAGRGPADGAPLVQPREARLEQRVGEIERGRRVERVEQRRRRCERIPM